MCFPWWIVGQLCPALLRTGGTAHTGPSRSSSLNSNPCVSFSLIYFIICPPPTHTHAHFLTYHPPVPLIAPLPVSPLQSTVSGGPAVTGVGLTRSLWSGWRRPSWTVSRPNPNPSLMPASAAPQRVRAPGGSERTQYAGCTVGREEEKPETFAPPCNTHTPAVRSTETCDLGSRGFKWNQNHTNVTEKLKDPSWWVGKNWCQQ